MRLIDADALIEAMKKTESEYENAMTCPSWWSAFNVISEQSTAYDIDKVVGELEELEVKAITRYKNGDFGDFDGVDYYIKKSETIEIVKQGGVADDFGDTYNYCPDCVVSMKEVKQMKTTGIVRRFDDLGRINIPLEIRRQLFGTAGKSEGMPMEIFMDGENIILRKCKGEAQ